MPGVAATEVSIRSAACQFPDVKRSTEELFDEEGIELTSEAAARLGIDGVHLCDGETGSQLALAAAQEAMAQAEIGPLDLGLIVDFTVLPQEYLVPAWSMGNKLQADLGAKKAFTLGFSGGGATNFQLALDAAASLLRDDERLITALLVAADVSIPGNRVLNPEWPMTILGDGASAVVLQRGSAGDVLVGTELRTEGALHDVCYIQGGAMRHPDRVDLYRLQIDRERYETAPKMAALGDVVARLLTKADLALDRVRAYDYSNLSFEDRHQFQGHLVGTGDGGGFWPDNTRGHGHVQGTDLVLNYLTARASGNVYDGDHVLIASHGMGFMYGATLLQHRE